MIFPPESINEIIKAVRRSWPEGGDRGALATDLEEAAQTFFVLRQWEKGPSHARRCDDFEKIAKAARRLAESLHIVDRASIRDAPPHIYSALVSRANLHAEKRGKEYEDAPSAPFKMGGETFVDWGGKTAALKATDWVWPIYQWAQEEYEARRRAAKAENMGELLPDDDPSAQVTAERWLNGFALPHIYERHFQEQFGVAKVGLRTGPPYGPGIRFIQECLKQMGIDKKPDAIEKLWDRYRKDMGHAPTE